MKSYSIEIPHNTCSEKSYEKVAYSMGVNGSNGAVFRGESGKLYAITRRNTVLAQYG